MTTVATPGPATTSTGSPLPLVALPQTELLTVNTAHIPVIRDALGPGVHFQPLRLDLEANEWVVLATFSPGATVPLHYHTGVVDGYTIQGSWYYKEYPDQVQTPGSYLFEPGGSVHTFVCSADNTEDTIVFFRVHGANINFTDDGQFHSILDTMLIAHLTVGLADAQGLGKVPYVQAGAARIAAGAEHSA